MPWKTPSKISIYTLSDPRTNEVRYVGKTIANLKDRLNVHIWYARKGNKTHRCNWIRLLISKGVLPIIEEIDHIDLDGDWISREQYWISYFKTKGYSLTNATIGGEGTHGRKHTEEELRKISAVHKGKIISKEQRIKQSVAMTGKKLTEERKRKVSEFFKGRKCSDETRKKMSIARAGRPQPQTSHENNGRAKLTQCQVDEIRNSKLSCGKLSNIYMMSRTQISRIKRGEQWKEVA